METSLLICHSSKSVGAQLSKYLASYDLFELEFCTNVVSSLNYVTSATPDLIVVGDFFEDGNTTDLIKKFKTTPTTQHIPILALPGDNTETFVTACHNAGVDGVLGFPFRQEDFVKTVKLLSGFGKSLSIHSDTHWEGFSV